MQICKNCRLLFDPSLMPGENDKFVDDFLCSWHPGEAEEVGNTGAKGDYAAVYHWTCCGQTRVGAVIRGRDYPPRRSPGCKRGHHVADPQLAVDPNLAQELQALQQRLRDIEAQEITGRTGQGVFISYSHRDCSFVDKLTQRLSADEITYWRDEKDILVGEVNRSSHLARYSSTHTLLDRLVAILDK